MTNTFPEFRAPSIPAGATADEWCDGPGQFDVSRTLSWSTHDTPKVGVGVDGTQYADGRIERFVALFPDEDRLSAVEARRRCCRTPRPTR
jgi:hypothetical protein